MSWPAKDPDEYLDYGMDWTAQLDGDTIASSQWIAPAGITIDNENLNGNITSMWVDGGTSGEVYSITNRITTIAGRKMDQSLVLQVTEL